MPGLAGPGAAADQDLAIVAELVEQRELGGELTLEQLLGVVEEAAAGGRLDAGPEDGEHPVALRWQDRLGDLVAEQVEPGAEPGVEVIAQDQQRP